MTNVSTPDDVSLDALVARVVDDFRERQERGEQPDVEEYADRHPDAAPLLRKVLAAFQLLDGSLPGTGGPDDIDDAPLAGTLGDFQLVREIGRGGMGIVYEAEQTSLGRRVALKVLPFASTLDAKQLQRFKNEALAAANLHHTNIVPVFATGCERGVHYYAMQFIQGQTLAAVIDDLRRRTRPNDVGQDSDPARCSDATTAFEPLPPKMSPPTLRLTPSPAFPPSGPTPPPLSFAAWPSSACRRRRRSNMLMASASSIATSSRPICCSTAPATCGSPTSAWPSARTRPA
jgi:hypothetical protein